MRNADWFCWVRSKSLVIGYFLLFLGSLGLDQGSKWHSEARLMLSSEGNHVRSYRAEKIRVMAVGVSPAQVKEREQQAVQKILGTSAWLEVAVTYVRNPGAAWGRFSRVPLGLRLVIFSVVTLAVTSIIVYLFLWLPSKAVLSKVALILIASGAWGNFLDRVQLGYVIDWLHLHWRFFGREMSFPVFNWADVGINLGLLIFLFSFTRMEILNYKLGKNGDAGA